MDFRCPNISLPFLSLLDLVVLLQWMVFYWESLCPQCSLVLSYQHHTNAFLVRVTRRHSTEECLADFMECLASLGRWEIGRIWRLCDRPFSRNENIGGSPHGHHTPLEALPSDKLILESDCLTLVYFSSCRRSCFRSSAGYACCSMAAQK